MSPWDSSAGTAICMQTDKAVLADIPGTELASKETRKTEREVFASKLSSITYSAKSEVFCLFYSRNLKSPKGTRSKWQDTVHLPYN